MGGIFGITKYIIPIGIIALSINLIHNSKDYITSKLMQYGIVVGCISAVLSIYEVAITKSLTMNQEFQSVLERASYLGTNNKGGGILGALIAYPLVKLLGVLGTVILTIGLAVIFIVFMFGFKPTEFISKMFERMKERRESEYDDDSNQENVVETKKERKLREKEERRIREEEERRKQAEEIGQLQLKFEENLADRKKYKHGEDDLMPLGVNKSGGMHDDPEYIEGNLFKQEEEKKEDNKREVLQLEHAIAVEDEHYEYPPINLLSKNTKKATKGSAKALTDTAAKLQKTLYSFGVSAKVEDVKVGPAITRYELKPSEGVRVSKIANLADDIALNLAAETIRIEAPIPGKQAVGIEVPNKEKEAVHLRDVIETEEFANNKSKLSVALGKMLQDKL